MSEMERSPEPATKTGTASDSQPKRPRRRRIWKLIAGLVLMAIPVLIWLAPQIVGRFASQPQVLQAFAPNWPKNLRIGKASLRWESPVLLRDVSLEAEDGSDMVSVDAVTSRESLWQLFSNVKLPLTLDLEGIETTCVVKRPHYGGRLDLDDELDAFAHALRRLAAVGFPSPPRKTTVRLTGGSITFVDERGNVLTRLAPVSGTCVLLPNDPELPQPPTERSELTLVLPVEQPAQKGECELRAEWSNLQAPVTADKDLGTASLALSDVPLDALQPLLTEALDGGQLEGRLDGELTVQMSRLSDGRVELGGDISLVAPDELGEPALLVVHSGKSSRPLYVQSMKSELGLSYDSISDRFTIAPLTLESDPVNISLKGTIEDLSRESVCDITGTVRSDNQDVVALIPPRLREQIEVQGLQLTGFSLRGPLRQRIQRPYSALRRRGLLSAADRPAMRPSAVENLSLSARLTWERLRGYGLEAQEGMLQVSLDDGVLRLTPVAVTVNRGQLRALPRVDLKQAPPVLEVTAGPILEDVELSDELCRTWLKFISPVTANATSVSGRLSLTAGTGIIPADSFKNARVAGTLRIRDGEIGPGPLVQPILNVVEDVQAIMGRGDGLHTTGRQPDPGRTPGGPPASDRNRRLKVKLLDRDVPFQLVQGRVHHQDLGFQAGEVQLSTSGSVGLDQTLDLMMRINLPEDWFLDKGPVVASLRGETIEVAVAGTLDDPKVDTRPLADLGKRVGVKAAGSLIFDLINKGLERPRDNDR